MAEGGAPQAGMTAVAVTENEEAQSPSGASSRFPVASFGFVPVDVAPLVYFRIVFGAFMLWEIVHHFRAGWVRHFYVEPTFYFTYLGFGWARPWPGNGMYVHFLVLGVMAAMITVGLCYRLAASLFFLGFTYVFLICQSLYLNHFYLIVLVSFLMVFVPAHRDGSVDAWLFPARQGRWASVWTLWLLRAQFGLVYFFGGLAKLNADWFRGEPLRTWLARRADYPVIGTWLTEEWVVQGMTYGGLVIDLFAVPALLWRPTRAVAVAALVSFHLINSSLFSIGIFPWLMLASIPLFFPPSSLRRFMRGPTPVSPSPDSAKAGAVSRTVVIALLGAYLLAQVLIPLRHHLYPGEVSWTEEGHNFSWHMKLRDKIGTVQFAANDPISGAYILIDPAEYLTPRQVRKMSTRPDMILQFAHFLADVLRDPGHPEVQVRALAYASLNGRPPQRLVSPEVDLAAQPRSLWPARWIVPLDGPDGGLKQVELVGRGSRSPR